MSSLESISTAPFSSPPNPVCAPAIGDPMITINDMTQIRDWDIYVAGKQTANPYQATAWQRIIAEAYGFPTHTLVAMPGSTATPSGESNSRLPAGILPLVHMKSPGLGSRLVSMPYFDHGGILADDEVVERQLIRAAVRLGRKLRVKRIELRQLHKLSTLENGRNADSTDSPLPPDADWSVKSHKVRMLLNLPSTSEELLKSFKSKLRSQINRPVKAGLHVRVGGLELLDDFYHVFSTTMHDLGSPVHAISLPRKVLEHLGGRAWIVVVYKKDLPVAASIMAGFKDVMINPWSAALRQHSKDSPNMLLYWHMLVNAADSGYRFFDFGRSTPGEGTYRFKTQWGAQPHPMYWYTIRLDGSHARASNHQEKPEDGKRREMLVSLWRQMPVSLSRIIGPVVRRHIDL